MHVKHSLLKLCDGAPFSRRATLLTGNMRSTSVREVVQSSQILARMQQQSWQQLPFTIYHSAKQSPVISELCPGMLAWICISASPFCLSASPFCLLASPVCVPVVMLCICSSHLQTAARFNPVQPQPLTSFGMLYRSPHHTPCQTILCVNSSHAYWLHALLWHCVRLC